MKKLLLVTCLVWSVSFLSGCGSQYLAEKVYWQANQAAKGIIQDRPLDKLITQDYQKIIAAYRRVAERCPLEPLAAQSQFIIAQIYILQGQHAKAKEELVKITQNFSSNPELASQAQFMIGNLYERQGDWEEAVLEYEKVTDLFPLSSIGFKTPIYVAEHYQRNKDEIQANNAYHKAIKHYNKIIGEYSGTSVVPVVKDYLALTYVSQDRWNDAIGVWQTITSEYPQSQIGASSLFAVGETYARQIKDLQKAIEVYEDFVKKNPTSKIVRYAKFQIGRIYFIKEDFTKAREVFAEIIKEYPQETELCTNSQLAAATCYERQGQWNSALDTYRKLTDNYPNTSAALSVPLFIAQYYLRENRTQEAETAFEEAISGYEKVIKEKPKTALAVEAQNLISLAYVNQQNWDRAIDSLKTLAETYPENPKAAGSVFIIAAIYQKQLQEPKKAIEIFQKFIEQYPRHVLASLAKSEIESLQKLIQ